ncbi:MAG: glycosyltransferase family 2 protein [Pseudomonadota bacterium]|nr:glycosyltransferase family 2 protein [Pseudomonadota bacterium]
MSEKVSVIIPVCNREVELRRAVLSVLNQTHKDIEVIVVENNSKDPELLRTVVNELDDERIVFHSLNMCKNANVARNFGMSVATGDYIGFLDSDDEFEPHHIQDSIRFITDNGLDFCFGSMRVFNGTTYRIAPARRLGPNESGPDYLFEGKGFEAQTATYVLTRKAAGLVEWDNELDRHQDWDFFCRLVETCRGDAKVEPSVIVHWMAGRKVRLPVSSVERFYGRWCEKMTPVMKRRFLFAKVQESARLRNPKLLMWALLTLASMFMPFSSSRPDRQR